MRSEITSSFYCFVYGHNYFHINKSQSDAPDLVCKCCKKFFRFNDDGQIIAEKQRLNTFIPLNLQKEI